MVDEKLMQIHDNSLDYVNEILDCVEELNKIRIRMWQKKNPWKLTESLPVLEKLDLLISEYREWIEEASLVGKP